MNFVWKYAMCDYKLQLGKGCDCVFLIKHCLMINNKLLLAKSGLMSFIRTLCQNWAFDSYFAFGKYWFFICINTFCPKWLDQHSF